MTIDHINIGIWVARILAAAIAPFVIIDFFKIYSGESLPTFQPVRNALAWALIACAGLIGAVSFIYFDRDYIARHDGYWPNFAVMAVWVLLALGLTERSIARAKQPRLIYLAAAIFLVGGFCLKSLDGALA